MDDWTRARRFLLSAGVVAAFVACSTAYSASDPASDAGSPDAADGPGDARESSPVDGGDASEASPGDAAGDAAVDAAVDAPAPSCDTAKPFGTPTVLASVSTAEDEGSPRLSDDELTLAFDGVRAADGGSPSYDLFIATRPSIGAPFGAPARLTSLDTSDHEFSPSLTADGLNIVFERQLTSTGVSTIMMATRPTLASAFGAPSALSNINSGNYTANPFVRGNASTVYYASVDNKPSIDLFVAVLIPATGYVTSKILDAPANESQGTPVVSHDGLALYFGWKANANFDIWVATRASTSATFGAPVPVTELNTLASSETPGWISPDGCRIYLASSRPGGPGGQDIYVAERPK
jgi:Tol biopolymer transport system component